MTSPARPRPDPFLAMCCCGRAHRSATLGGAERWRDWHVRVGVEGCDHVVMVSYEPSARGGATQPIGRIGYRAGQPEEDR